MEITTFVFVYFSFLVFAIGACIGSFLNVCIYRIPREESVVAPRSHCPHCNKMIPWYDNLPLFSFLVLAGRCRNCKGVISVRYFLVELLTAILFLMVWFHYGFDARTPVYWLMVSGLILGMFVDFEHMIIPDRVTLGGVVAGLVLSPLVPSLHDASGPLESFVAALIGMVTGAGILWGIGFIGKLIVRKDAMGMGDVKLLGGLGALLGWQAVLFTIMISAMLGSCVGIALILSRSKKWRSRIPYGPYLALAAVIWILWGKEWWDMYFAWVADGTL